MIVWLLCILLVLSVATGHGGDGHSSCGAPDPTDDQKQRDGALMARYRRNKKKQQHPSIFSRGATVLGEQQQQQALCKQCVEIDVVFHILEDSLQMTNASLLWTDEGIDAEMKLLNHRFNETPFHFSLLNTTRSYNDTVATMIPKPGHPWTSFQPFLEMVQSLRVGDENTMNIFVSAGICDEAGGFVGELDFSKYGMFPENEFSATDMVGLCDDTFNS